jgi:hypothetical protein
MNTLEMGEGELITVRRPGHGETKKNVQDFLPCEFCLGFFRKWDLWKHQASCPNKPPRVISPTQQQTGAAICKTVDRSYINRERHPYP